MIATSRMATEGHGILDLSVLFFSVFFRGFRDHKAVVDVLREQVLPAVTAAVRA